MTNLKFKNKRVVIMGLGLHGGGVSVAKFFCKQGADVLVTDLKTKKELKESIDKLKGLKIEYVLGKHRKEDFKKADFIIKNPDVPNNSPFLKVAKKHKIPIETDISLFFKLAESAFIIGVTGTKGKSTTATLIYKFLKSKPRSRINSLRDKCQNTYLVGNIGISPLELLSKIKKKDKVVLELSSFVLEDLKQSPQIAVITNILPDHLNRYKNMKDYIEAKKRIFKFQNKNDCLILNYEDPIVKKFSSGVKAKVYFFSAKELGSGYNNKEFKIFGYHNLSNISAAVKVAKILKISDKMILKVLKSFKGVEFRQQFIKENKGVKYFNDTTATMPDAVIEALNTFKEKFPGSNLILIAGGQDKKLNYKEMAKTIKDKADFLVLLPGTGTDKLKKELKKYAKIYLENSMKNAVKRASKLARKGSIVLLSPGGASFNLFKNEFDRGEQFNKFIKKL